MPRGVYPRKPRAQKSAAAKTTKTAAKTPKLTKTGKPRRRRRTKAEMQAARAAEKTAKKTTAKKSYAKRGPRQALTGATSGRTLSPLEKFETVRQNISALSQVRTNLSARNADVSAVDEELQKELELMGALREQHFGVLPLDPVETSAETSGDNGMSASMSAPATVPLPPPPQIQPPPAHQS